MMSSWQSALAQLMADTVPNAWHASMASSSQEGCTGQWRCTELPTWASTSALLALAAPAPDALSVRAPIWPFHNRLATPAPEAAQRAMEPCQIARTPDTWKQAGCGTAGQPL